jgi:hypothetical protein
MWLVIDHQKIVNDVLKQLYASYEELEAFLMRVTTTPLADISARDALEVVRWRIIRAAQNKGWMEDLLNELRADAKGNALAQLDELGTMEELKEGPFADCFVDGDPLVDREPLRTKLRDATTDHAKRILIVRGNRYTGKSHAVRHIRYVCSRLGIPLADIALRDYRKRPGMDVGPTVLGEKIAAALDKDFPLLDGKEARWSINFVDWVGRQIKPTRASLWIAIDDFESEKFNNVELPDATHEFIQILAEQIADRLPSVRLFLINYERDLPNEVTYHVHEDKTPVITEEDLVFWFLDYYRNYKPQVTPEDAAAEAAKRARAVFTDMNALDPKDRLTSMRGALRAQVDGMP